MILPTSKVDPSETYVEGDAIVSGEESADTVYPTKTWRLDKEQGRITEVIDDEEAVEQFIVKALRTARSKFFIYNDQYGTDLYDLIGKDNSRNLVSAEIPRLLTETIIYDDRILRVRDIDVSFITSDAVHVKATVDTVYGVSDVDIII